MRFWQNCIVLVYSNSPHPCLFSCIDWISIASLCVLWNIYSCVSTFVLQHIDPYCKMTSEELFHLPLNVYIIILGIGLFILMLSLVFCCYLFRYMTITEAAQNWTMFLEIKRPSSPTHLLLTGLSYLNHSASAHTGIMINYQTIQNSKLIQTQGNTQIDIS